MEILSKTTENVIVGETFGVNTPAIVLTILFLVFVALFILGLKYNIDALVVLSLILGIVSCALSVGFWSSKPVYKEVTTYKVTINDNYPYNQLVDHYDIIDQEGRILTIREKGWDDINNGNS